MKNTFTCERPACNKRFGLARRTTLRWTGRWWHNTHYCSELCMKLHTAERTAESNKEKRWLGFLAR